MNGGRRFEPLAWDTAFFGFDIARMSSADLSPDAVAQADAAGVRCLYLLAEADDPATLHRAQALGFRVYDVRVTLDRDTTGAGACPPSVRTAAADDVPALEAIARERFTATRFFADPHFPRDRAGDLYVAWLHGALDDSPGRRVLVAGDADGFIVTRHDRDAGEGSIELVAVAASAAGTGLGSALVRAATASFAAGGLPHATVVTQGRNIAALRLYERHAFRTAATAVWLHRWQA